MKKVFFLYIVLAFIAFTQAQAQQTKRIYQFGNSVTDGINYGGFKNMANSQGNTHIWARHVIPGASLVWLWDHPNDGFLVPPYGTPANAFTNYDWDVVTLQPFNENIENDKAMLLNYANLLKDKSPDVQFYIYSRYPRCPGGDAQIRNVTAEQWTNLWNRTDGNQESRKFFEDLYTAFNATNKGGLNKGALIIPVGDVMNTLNEKAVAGQVPGVTKIWDVYKDGIHVNNIGAYLIMGTFYSTIYKEDIRGTKVPADYGTIDPAIVEIIQETIFDVVFTHPYSGTSTDDLIEVTGIDLDQETLSMNILNQTQLNASVIPANAGKKGVIWSSSNTGVAMVSDKGVVTSLSEGTAIITAKSFDGGFTGQCEVTVAGTLSGTSKSGTLAAWNFNDKVNPNKAGYNYKYAVDSLSGIGFTNAYVGEGGTVDQNWDRGLAMNNQTMLDLPTSIADGEYIAFKIKAEPGKLLSVSKVQFAPISQNHERTFVLMSSVKGFSVGNELGTCKKNHEGTMFSFDITGHNNVDEIEFRVYAYGINSSGQSVGIGGMSGNSIIITGSILTPENNPPTTPENLKAIQVTDTNISFEWNEATDDYFVKGYNVYLNGTKKNNEPVEATNFAIEGLSSGQLYDIEVEAVDYFNIASVTKGLLSIHANRPPVAAISASATSGQAPVTITFGSNDSTDPDKDEGDYVLGFDWYVNGEIQPDNSNTFEHTFTRSGSYEIGLVVMDSRGMRSTTTDKVTVNITALKYAVAITGGKTVPEATEAEGGDKVTIKADEQAEGMVFDSWTSDDIEFDDATASETTFIMPAKAVTVTATYKYIEYTITVENGYADKETAKIGDVITIEALIPTNGSSFTRWDSNDVTFEDETNMTTTFIMPAKAVTVTAVLNNIGTEQGKAETFTLSPNPADSYIIIEGVSGAAFSIVDVTGVEVLSGTADNSESISVASLAPGYYIFRTEGKALPFVKK